MQLYTKTYKLKQEVDVSMFSFARDLVRTVFQTDKDWESRILAFTLAWGVAWAVVGGGDAMLVRLQESAYSLTSNLIATPWVYYAALTLHASRLLFGFAQQIEMGIFVYLAIKLTGKEPFSRWMVWLSLVLINASIFLLEGPIAPNANFLDSYFSAVGWDSLAPLGVPGYSQYVVSPLWWLGWLLLEVSTFLWGVWVLLAFLRKRTGKLDYISFFIVLTTLLFVLGYIAPFVSTNWELASAFFGLPLDTLVNQTIFWFYGHAVVYMLFLPAVVVLYFAIPLLVGRKIYSERLAMIAAILYFAFSGIVPIHHLYLTVFPYWITIAQEVMTYGVVVPSIMTFFNLWATAKGVKNISWNVPAAFAVVSFGGAIAAGVTGVANATVSFDAVIHNTMWVVGHFHAMIDLMIVPAAFALVYLLQPVIMKRGWYSKRFAWLHFWLTLVGGAGISIFMDALGLEGVLRRSMTFPLVGSVPLDEVALTVSALLFGLGQVFFVLNVIGSMYRGRPLDFSGLSFGQSLLLGAADLAYGAAANASTIAEASSADEARKERLHKAKTKAEVIWTLMAVSLLALTALLTAPYAMHEGGALSNVPAEYLDPGNVVNIRAVAYQYYWVFEQQNVSSLNYFVVYPSAKVLINGTASSGNALANLYMPIFSDRVVDNQLYQGYNSYIWFDAPSIPGIYGFMNGEYNGPFYTYMGGEMLVMPPQGLLTQEELQQYLASVSQDPYTPPINMYKGEAQLVMSRFGMWNDTDPAPTIVVKNSSAVTLKFYVPVEAVTSVSNYMLNITSSNFETETLNYLTMHNNTLPYVIQLIHILPNGQAQVIGSAGMKVGTPIQLSFTAQPGAYVYGVINPISYRLDPNGLSSMLMGESQGQISSLWGMVLVTQ
ncbi:MAG: cbb3-type cytochrome c oxidase subunit I [Conexivisphaerales archaeon]